MGMPHEMAGRVFPRNVRRVAANLFSLAAAFAVPVAVAVCVALALDRGWHAVGLALFVLAARPVGEMAAEALYRYDNIYPPVWWWVWRVFFATGSVVAGLAITSSA